MRANVEDRGMKGDCTPLMEAASAGHTDIVRYKITHDVGCRDLRPKGSWGGWGHFHLAVLMRVFSNLILCFSLALRYHCQGGGGGLSRV